MYDVSSSPNHHLPDLMWSTIIVSSSSSEKSSSSSAHTYPPVQSSHLKQSIHPPSHLPLSLPQIPNQISDMSTYTKVTATALPDEIDLASIPRLPTPKLPKVKLSQANNTRYPPLRTNMITCFEYCPVNDECAVICGKTIDSKTTKPQRDCRILLLLLDAS